MFLGWYVDTHKTHYWCLYQGDINPLLLIARPCDLPGVTFLTLEPVSFRWCQSRGGPILPEKLQHSFR